MGGSKKTRNKPSRLTHENKAGTSTHALPSSLGLGQAGQTVRWALAIAIGVVVAAIYSAHVAGLMENDRFFSALTTTERELSFRSEQAMYYSFFKRLVKQSVAGNGGPSSIYNGIKELLDDPLPEHPSRINSLSRFNLYQEVVLSLAYHAYHSLRNLMSLPHDLHCYTIRQQGRVMESCEGMAVPEEFYVKVQARRLNFNVSGQKAITRMPWMFAIDLATGDVCGGVGMMSSYCDSFAYHVPWYNVARVMGYKAVFGLQSLFAFSLFLSAFILADSILVACACVPLASYNLTEMTRVMWTPPLREHFGFPFFAAQLALLCFVMRRGKSSTTISGLYMMMTLCFLISWQFAPFACFMLNSALHVAFVAGAIHVTLFRHLLLLSGVSMLVVVVAMFFNPFWVSALCLWQIPGLLLLSYWPCTGAGSISVYVSLTKRWAWRLSQLSLGLGMTFGSKAAINLLLGISEDSHIFSILRSKFDSSFFDFHAKLYTCAPEFDFMHEEYGKLALSGLLPLAAFGLLSTAVQFLIADWKSLQSISAPESTGKHAANTTEEEFEQASLHGSTPCIHGTLACQVFLAAVSLEFTVLAALIMRLKLFWVPTLLLLAAAGLSSKTWEKVLTVVGISQKRHRFFHALVVVVIIAALSVRGVPDTLQRIARQSEFNAPKELELTEWILKNTDHEASFTSSMPATSFILCSTGRRIVNHPHYEHAEVRNRTRELYRVYGRATEEEVNAIMSKYDVDYVVLDYRRCIGMPKAGCRTLDLYDQLEPERRKLHPQYCARWMMEGIQSSAHFVRVFKNQLFHVLARRGARHSGA